MNSYLERNAEIIEEIKGELKNGLILERKFIERSTSGTRFETLGHPYNSKVLGRPLYLGYKESPNRNPRFAAFMDIAIVRAVIKIIPEYENDFPIFLGRLTSPKTGHKGIIVEDLSGAGTIPVTQVKLEEARKNGTLPVELRKLNPNLTDETLANASFLVGEEGFQRRMILDIADLRSGITTHEVEETFPWEDIFSNTERYTVNTPQLD